MQKVYNKTLKKSYSNMETYKIIFNEEENEGVYAVSLVSDPAIGVNFITLSKQKEIKLATVNEEQRILMGAILIPNQPIYRRDEKSGHEFNIVFPKETIKQVQQNFALKGYQNNSTIEHSGEQIQNVTFVESWIKEDEVHDKSVHYGFNEEVGSWFGLMKVNNDEIWNDYVKTGKVKGFSIDGVFDMEKVNLKTEINMNLESIVNAIKEGFASITLSTETEQVVIQMETMMLKDGVTILEAESFEAGQAVFIVAENGDKVAAPIGEHELEDGRVLVITEEGLIAEIKDAMVEEETLADDVEVEVEMTTEEMIKAIVTNMSVEVSKQIEAIRTELSAQIAEVKTSKVEVKASTKAKPEVAETSTKNVKLSRSQKILNNLKK